MFRHIDTEPNTHPSSTRHPTDTACDSDQADAVPMARARHTSSLLNEVGATKLLLFRPSSPGFLRRRGRRRPSPNPPFFRFPSLTLPLFKDNPQALGNKRQRKA